MPQQSALNLLVKRLTSRSYLSDSDQRSILELPGRLKRVTANEYVVSLGERVLHASLVVDGLVGQIDQNANGERQITALYITGDMPDLHSVVQAKASSALQALATSTLYLVPQRALRDLAAERPAIAEAFWRDCSVDVAVLAQWVANLGRRDALSRMAHLLCEMAWRYKVAPADGPVAFELPITQSQLADATGMTAVHVNRTLKKLTVIGTTLTGKVVRVEDWHALAVIGDFDPAYLQTDVRPEERLRMAQ